MLKLDASLVLPWLLPSLLGMQLTTITLDDNKLKLTNYGKAISDAILLGKLHRNGLSEVVAAPMRVLHAIAARPTLATLRVALMYGMCDPIATKNEGVVFERMCLLTIGK